MLDQTDLTDAERQLLAESAEGRQLDLRPRQGTKIDPAELRDLKVPIRGTVIVSLLTEDLPEGVAAPLEAVS